MNLNVWCDIGVKVYFKNIDPTDLASFFIKIILFLLNYSGAFVINEVIMKNGFVPGLCFVSLIKLIIIDSTLS